MRIIAGEKRGLKLFSPKGDLTRPTEDRIKENLFNILGQNFYDDIILDLFSGTGSIAVEFLSRGAKSAVLIDNNKDAIDIIKKNLTKSGFFNKAKVFQKDAVELIKTFDEYEFDYIFIDPPYIDDSLYVNSIKNIIKYKILKENGKIIIEEDASKKRDFSEFLSLEKEKKYGSTIISIWSYKWR